MIDKIPIVQKMISKIATKAYIRGYALAFEHIAVNIEADKFTKGNDPEGVQMIADNIRNLKMPLVERITLAKEAFDNQHTTKH